MHLLDSALSDRWAVIWRWLKHSEWALHVTEPTVTGSGLPHGPAAGWWLLPLSVSSSAKIQLLLLICFTAINTQWQPVLGKALIQRQRRWKTWFNSMKKANGHSLTHSHRNTPNILTEGRWAEEMEGQLQWLQIVRLPSCFNDAVIMFLRNDICRQPHSYFNPAVYFLSF